MLVTKNIRNKCLWIRHPSVLNMKEITKVDILTEQKKLLDIIVNASFHRFFGEFYSSFLTAVACLFMTSLNIAMVLCSSSNDLAL